MKCIDKKWLLFLGMLALIYMTGCEKNTESAVLVYEAEHYNHAVYAGNLLAEDLCVSETDVSADGFSCSENLLSTALFDVENKEVLYSYKIHERNYPASITKIMTALLTLEHGNLEDTVTISSTADASNFSIYAQVCGIKEGDVWTLEDLLNALLIYSGNDVAVAIAEHIGGTEENFVNMMNQKARELSAVNTHFMNPHGLHDDMHYSTAYDLYLIFNECTKDERFVEIINRDSYTVEYTRADGSLVKTEYHPTNLYASGSVSKPENFTLIGGKTGTTDDMKRCLILLVEDSESNPYISIVLSADDKSVLYKNMTALIQEIPELQ